MAAKYYAVRKGRKPGIYRTWDAFSESPSNAISCPPYNFFIYIYSSSVYSALSNSSSLESRFSRSTITFSAISLA